MHPTKLFLTWYVDTVLQSFKKVSGFNDASVPNFKGFKCGHAIRQAISEKLNFNPL